MNWSIQLWSVNDDTQKDFKGTLKKLGALGYNGVEFAGYGGMNGDEMKAALDDAGLYAVGSHTGIDVFRNGLEEEIEFHKKVGSKYIIIPYTELKTKEQLDELISLYNKWSPVAKEAGIKLGYHNHQHEFAKMDGKYIMDIIADETDDNVVLELDVYWAEFAGVDPIDYINKMGEKIELIHLKQIGKETENCRLSEGRINMSDVVKAAKYATHFVVEQEEYDKPVWDITKNNIDFLRGI